MKRILLYQFPWIFLMVGLTVQSSFKSAYIQEMVFHFNDKILHFIVFGFLGVLLARGFYFSKIKKLNKNFMLYAVIAAFAFSISDELHQVFVPGRSADIFDLIADFAGILVLTYLYKYLLKKYKALNI